MIAIDQDKAGHQARRAWQSGEQEVWSRDLAGGDIAIAIFNRAADEARVVFRWADVGITKTPNRARDLWAHAGVKLKGPEYSTPVPGHGVVLLRVR